MTTPPVAAAPPSRRQLIRATFISIAVMAVIVVVAVLPAEYNIDPTGFGGRLGLLRPDASGGGDVASSDVATSATPVAVTKSPTPYRTDETTITLKTGESAEIKATMRRQDRLVFSWTAEGGPVDFEMHGEPANAVGGEYTSYWKDDEKESGHGSFEAPFDGTHGWYWLNLETDPVTIRLRTSGFYEKIGRLATPVAPGAR
jgi:hypothetical protein